MSWDTAHFIINRIKTLLSSKIAAESGNELSMVTTGEKYSWDHKLSKCVLDVNPNANTINEYDIGTMWFVEDTQ